MSDNIIPFRSRAELEAERQSALSRHRPAAPTEPLPPGVAATPDDVLAMIATGQWQDLLIVGIHVDGTCYAANSAMSPERLAWLAEQACAWARTDSDAESTSEPA